MNISETPRIPSLLSPTFSGPFARIRGYFAVLERNRGEWLRLARVLGILPVVGGFVRGGA
jgi:hypothetical protein